MDNISSKNYEVKSIHEKKLEDRNMKLEEFKKNRIARIFESISRRKSNRCKGSKIDDKFSDVLLKQRLCKKK